MSRRINFSLNTSMAALVRSSVDEVMVMASSPCHSMWVSVPRKSNRVESSLAAWLRALSTSWRSTLLTTSKLESAIALASSRCARKYYPTTPNSTFRRQSASRSLQNVDLGAGVDMAVFVQSASSLYPASRTMAGCPSGQWERTVNPSAYAYAGSNPAPATIGHTLHLPPRPAPVTGSGSADRQRWRARTLTVSTPAAAAVPYCYARQLFLHGERAIRKEPFLEHKLDEVEGTTGHDRGCRRCDGWGLRFEFHAICHLLQRQLTRTGD